MKTDQLIDMLSTNVEPVQQGKLRKTLVWALVVGGAAAFCLMLATVGLRTGVTDGFLPGYLTLKLVFTLSLIGVGAALLESLMRRWPGWAKTPLVCVSSFLHCYMRSRCCAGIWAADGMGSRDFRNAVGDLPALYPALCGRPICSVDLGSAQRSTHEFEASRGYRRTCCRG
jgi:hypothetical protein